MGYHTNYLSMEKFEHTLSTGVCRASTYWCCSKSAASTDLVAVEAIQQCSATTHVYSNPHLSCEELPGIFSYVVHHFFVYSPCEVTEAVFPVSELAMRFDAPWIFLGSEKAQKAGMRGKHSIYKVKWTMLQYLISLINVAAVLKRSTIHFFNSSLLKKLTSWLY